MVLTFQFSSGLGPPLWTEILEDKDFFSFEIPDGIDAKDVVVCTNPPYSLLHKVLVKVLALRPRIINLLIGLMNFTPFRAQLMEEAGYQRPRLSGWL
jgi:hypothetical protein